MDCWHTTFLFLQIRFQLQQNRFVKLKKNYRQLVNYIFEQISGSLPCTKKETIHMIK